MKSTSLTKYMFIVTGTICLVLGLIGVFIPVLPTTPFLLLTSFCYLRGSTKLYNWLIHHRIIGAYIYNYLTYKAVKKSVKVGSIVFLWCSLGISIFVVENLRVDIILSIVGLAVSIHLLNLKTIKDVTYPAAPEIEED